MVGLKGERWGGTVGEVVNKYLSLCNKAPMLTAQVCLALGFEAPEILCRMRFAPPTFANMRDE